MIDFSQIPKEEKERKPTQPSDSAENISFSSFPPKESSGEKISFSEAGKDLSLDKDLVLSQGYLQAKEAYQEALSLAESILMGSFSSSQINQAKAIVESFIGFTEKGEQELLSFVFSPSSYPVHYLSLNLVNVCILSLEIGLWLGFGRDALFKLGLASLLHDVGMSAFLDLANQPKSLSLSDFQKIKIHPQKGRELLREVNLGREEDVLLAVEQEHERFNGSGYPKGLRGEEIIELAQIIGFVDVYEALTHKRPYRPAFSPEEAIKIMLSKKDSFSSKVGKAFLEKIGLYPKGIIVELNTKEIGYVIRHSPKTPTSPWVKVLFDSQGKRLPKSKEIDLSKSPAVYIIKTRI